MSRPLVVEAIETEKASTLSCVSRRDNLISFCEIENQRNRRSGGIKIQEREIGENPREERDIT
ncbi:hypothetical protein COLO4_34552 [Corchorus olitorius]|uniref:Uncharacterized protein n=1 Tax=Corchorus olitorius TaxID=93759 RepID=A0A1R3GKC2_9ROSI|nr:hypothetical protein COLO4_34552 [Corchorus olitorius]